MPSERALIDAFLSRFDAPGRRAQLAAGDDCAVLPPSKDALCVTTDALVERVHFTLPAFSLEDVGHKALAVNLSDLAAMGAAPAWFVCAIAMPRSYGRREVTRLAKGMAALARTHGIALVGGNFTAAAELSLTLTAAGHTQPGQALTRAGAKAKDLLYVSGTLGDARVGLRALAEGRGRSALARRQRRPTPRVGLGLLARRFASAAIDLSDGLGADLGHLCRASGVGARVAMEALPLSGALLEQTGSVEAARQEAARGGEDYELLLAVPAARARAFEMAARRAGERVTRVGALTSGRAVRFGTPGRRAVAPPPGHDHFG